MTSYVLLFVPVGAETQHMVQSCQAQYHLYASLALVVCRLGSGELWCLLASSAEREGNCPRTIAVVHMLAVLPASAASPPAGTWVRKRSSLLDFLADLRESLSAACLPNSAHPTSMNSFPRLG